MKEWKALKSSKVYMPMFQKVKGFMLFIMNKKLLRLTIYADFCIILKVMKKQTKKRYLIPTSTRNFGGRLLK